MRYFLTLVLAGLCSLAFAQKTDWYDTQFEKADSVFELHQTRTALDILDKAAIRAGKEKREDLRIKALILQAKYVSRIEENTLVETIERLKSARKGSPAPTVALLNSLLGELYWQYYQNNRWQYQTRSELAADTARDPNTWSIRQIIDTAKYHYLTSLEPAEQLFRIPVGDFELLLVDEFGTERDLRPTLYDLLAHRAVDLLRNSEMSLTQPADVFRIDQAVYFAPPHLFSDWPLAVNDSSNAQRLSLKILQRLTQFHLRDKNPQALIDLELKRLSLVHAHFVGENKDSLYLRALYDRIERFKSDPDVTRIYYEAASLIKQQGNAYNPLGDTTARWLWVEARDLAQTGVDLYPKSRGAANCISLIRSLEARELSIEHESIETPDTPIRAIARHRNLGKLTFHLVKTSEEEYNSFNGQSYADRVRVAFYRAQPAVAHWNQALPSTNGDLQAHHTEVDIPGQKAGYYVLLVGSSDSLGMEGEAVSLSILLVTDIGYFARRLADGSFEISVRSRTTGKPSSGAKVTLVRRYYDSKAREYKKEMLRATSTDRDGLVRFEIPRRKDYASYGVSIAEGGDVFESSQFLYHSEPEREQAPQTRLTILTDRSIYRPGQPIHYKAVLYQADQKTPQVLAGRTFTIEFLDVNNQKLSEQLVKTNEYGSVHGTFFAPEGGLLGSMQLHTHYGSKSIRVEEYKRPTFQVTLDPREGSAALGDSILVTGKAMSYAGAAIDGAQVKYTVTRSTYVNPWWAWRCGWYYWSSPPSQVIAQGETTSEVDGSFEVKFLALPDPTIDAKLRPVFTYEVTVEVTDIAGETHTASRSTRLGYHSLELSVSLPSWKPEAKLKPLSISTRNLDYQKLEAKGELKIYRLTPPSHVLRDQALSQSDLYEHSEAEHYRLFPHDPYGQAGKPESWPRGPVLATLRFDTGDTSRYDFPLKGLTPGYYAVEAWAIEADGDTARWGTTWTWNDPKSKSMPQPEFFSTDVLTSSLKPGETAQVLVGSSVDGWVLCEVEWEGNIVDRFWKRPKNGQLLVEYKAEEKHRGGFAFHFTMMHANRKFTTSHWVSVPYEDYLEVKLKTHRDLLEPGEKEKWTLVVKGANGAKLAAEVAATMYDASLDVFTGHYWGLSGRLYTWTKRNWSYDSGFQRRGYARLVTINWNPSTGEYGFSYDRLDWLGLLYELSRYGRYGGYGYMSRSRGGFDDVDGFGEGEMMMDMAVEEVDAPMTESPSPVASAAFKEKDASPPPAPPAGKAVNARESGGETNEATGDIPVRKDFRETALFVPQLRTNEKGEVEIEFTMPEALTEWKFMALAHTKDLKVGQTQAKVKTQKELMVQANAPRFLREGDTIRFSGKVTNLTADTLSAEVVLSLYDARTMKPISGAYQLIDGDTSVQVPAGQSRAVFWTLVVPEGGSAITYRLTAETENHRDGEERMLPVLPNRMLVTETMPLPLRGTQTKSFTFSKLVNNKSTTLRHHRLTLEFTNAPVWTAIQALPYLMEFPHECAEQTFSRLYANSLAAHIVNGNPRIKQVFDTWRDLEPEAFLSNLEKNQELKAVMLEETPWVLEAKDETERHKRVAILFDLDRMAREEGLAIRKLAQMQYPSGAWPWFDGLPESEYVTRHIIGGLGKLRHVGVDRIFDDPKVKGMMSLGVDYLDREVRARYDYLLRLHKEGRIDTADQQIGYDDIHSLYVRSFYPEMTYEGTSAEAYAYFFRQEQKYWMNFARYQQGMISLALFRKEDAKTANLILRGFRESAIYHEELGTYFKDLNPGYYWYNAPLETQALLIEAFYEIASDSTMTDGLATWLLKNKQTNAWPTTKSTTEAVYALLLQGGDWVETGTVKFTIGKETFTPEEREATPQAGTGYFKTVWEGSEISEEMGNVTVARTGKGPAWGALYWQYFEQLDKITAAKTPLSLEREVLVERPSPTGAKLTRINEKNVLNPGDRIIVRITVRTDRDMEFVHLKDLRAATLEPEIALSGHRYQDGLWRYQSTRDVATHFFFHNLPKGTYVFEYPLRVTHAGNFSNGISSIQCMYAPEFASHSAGIRLTVETK